MPPPRTNRRRRLAARILLTSAWLSFTTAAHSQPVPDAGEPVSLEPVFVTARRRPEDAFLAPVSASVLGAKEVAELGITGFDQVGQTVPNLNVQHRFGAGSGPLLSIRGQDSGSINFESDSRASLYLDDVFMGRIGAMSAFMLADLCGMEVLRGPQGTMFGASAVGGVIRLASCSPGRQQGLGNITLGAGNFGQRQARVVLDGHIGGGLSARIALLRDSHQGWGRNASPGVVTQLSEPFGTVVSAERLGDAATTALALALRHETPGGLTLDYRYDRTSRRETQVPAQLLAVYGGIAGQLDPGAGAGGAQPDLGRRLSVAEEFLSPSRLALDGHSLTAALRWHDALSLKYIATRRRMREHGGGNDIDGSSLNANFLGLAKLPTPAGDRVCYLCSHSVKSLQQGSQEVRLMFRSGAWDTTGGLFHFRESGFHDNAVFVGGRFQAGVLNSVGALSRMVPSDYFSGRKVQVDNSSLAAFGHAKYEFSDALTLSAGLRRTLDRRKTEVLESPAQARDGDVRFSYWDGEVTARYAWGPGLGSHVRFSTTHLAGGTQAGIAFAPEFSRSAELGLKAQSRDRRVRLDVAVFHNRVQHQQLGNFSPDLGTHIIDAGASTQQGLELELQAQATPRLGLHASYGLIRASTDNGLRAFTPRQTLYLGAEYAFARLESGAQTVFRLDASWRSEAAPSLCLVGQAVTSQGCQGTGDASLTRAVSIPARTDWSARLSLKQISLGARARAQGSLWVKNLFDSRKLQFARDMGNGTVIGSFEGPRTVGVELSASF